MLWILESSVTVMETVESVIGLRETAASVSGLPGKLDKQKNFLKGILSETLNAALSE